MNRPAPHSAPPASADVRRTLEAWSRAARGEEPPRLDVTARVMGALARRRVAVVAAQADDGAAPLGWLAAAALAAAVAVALLALPVLHSLSGPLLEVYGMLGGGAL